MRRPRVVIIGAGPSGASAALALRQLGAADVLVLDKSVYPRVKVCGSGLSPLALAVLDQLRLRDRFRARHAVIAGLWARGPDGGEVRFAAGDGVGTVTKPGLQVPPGEPAINPGPRRMIVAAVRETAMEGATVTISIPGGRELAARTFNPRLGVSGGLSILGTTGRVRPFSVPALRDALACALDVALACGVRAPVLVPGNIGERAARRHFKLTDEQVIHAGNEWGFMLDRAAERPFDRLLVVGHPGKLAKLADGQWDTHSNRSPAATAAVARVAARIGIALPADAETAEGLFEGLAAAARGRLGPALATEVRGAVEARVRRPTAVALVSMNGDLLGADGDITPWQ